MEQLRALLHQRPLYVDVSHALKILQIDHATFDKRTNIFSVKNSESP